MSRHELQHDERRELALDRINRGGGGPSSPPSEPPFPHMHRRAGRPERRASRANRGTRCVRARRTLHHGMDGTSEIAPLALSPGKRAVAFRGELVDAPAAAVHLRPPARHQAGALQPVQRGIERAFGQIERSTAARAQGFRDGIPVGGPGLHGREQEQVEVSLEGFSVHPSRCYASQCDVSRWTQWITQLFVRPCASMVMSTFTGW
jgi:hypothetical protein